MDLASQTVLVSAFVADWIRKSDFRCRLAQEYDVIKRRSATKNTVKHILVEKEDDAKDVIAQLQRARSSMMEAMARSRTGSGQGWRPRLERAGGDRQAILGRHGCHAEGKFSTVPVQTQFGYHMIWSTMSARPRCRRSTK
jgi:peptidyl-prolyl cis-trans isomerase C